MLSFNIIREDILPNIEEIGEFIFISGEKRTLAVQMLNFYTKRPKFFSKTNWFSLFELPTIDSASPLFREGVINNCEDDSSIITTELSVDDTKSVIGGNLVICMISKTDVEDIVPAMADAVTYDSATGKVTVDDSVDLSSVMQGMIFKDFAGNQFLILGDVDETAGQKGFLIGKGLTVDLSAGASIERSLNVQKAMKKNVIVKEKSAC